MVEQRPVSRVVTEPEICGRQPIRLLPRETPAPAELRAIRRGEAAYRRGDYITLDEYFRELDRHSRRAGKKGA